LEEALDEQLRSASVFLIEDHTPDVFLIEKALMDSGVSCHVTRCSDGEQALVTLGMVRLKPEAHPKLVLLDLNLPIVGGMDVLRAIRQDPALEDLPVVVLTSSEAPRDREEAMMLGAARFITKPPELRAYMDTIGGVARDFLASPP
jgi:CheY-like chemotaxis protein